MAYRGIGVDSAWARDAPAAQAATAIATAHGIRRTSMRCIRTRRGAIITTNYSRGKLPVRGIQRCGGARCSHLRTLCGYDERVPIETVFLDAGGVLVFPNWERVAETFARHGLHVSANALRAAD